MFDFQKILADARAKSGLSYAKLEKISGFSAPMLHHYECNNCAIPILKANDILVALGVAAEIGAEASDAVMTDIDHLSATLRRERKNAGLSVQKLSGKSGICENTIFRAEHEAVASTLFTVEAICTVLGIRVRIGKEKCRCAKCGRTIVTNETYYRIGGKTFCPDCVSVSKVK